MSNEDVVITHPQGGWSAVHDLQVPGGPVRLAVGLHPLLEGFHNRLNEYTDEHLLVDRCKVFRKSGSAVFHGEGHVPSGPESGWRNVVRYAGNTARVTCDFSWKAGTVLDSGVEIGSLTLPGMWEKVQVLSINPDSSVIGAPESHRLQIGKSVRFPEFPLALLFFSVHGGRLEVGFGDDLWRWQHGLGVVQGGGGIRLECRKEGVMLHRIVALAPNSPEDPAPLARDYRFTSYLAWRAPQLDKLSDVTGSHPLSLLSGELSRPALEECGSVPSLSLDFDELPLPHQARRQLVGGAPGALCWESRITQKAVRKVTRQLAEYASEGQLLIRGGAIPGLCSDAVHCARKSPALHWDMLALIDTFSWMQQRLGNGWRIRVQQADFWADFPATAQLGAPNGFRNKAADALADDDVED